MIIRFLATGLLIFYSSFAFANMDFVNRPDVQAFMREMIKKHHFKKAELITWFNAVKIRPQVIKKVKAPMEQKPWYLYQMLFITESRIREGVEFWDKYADTLAKAEKIYGVPADIIVATIGVETKYGRHTGEYPVIDALTNIAFSDSPRAPFFRSELIEFLLLAREQHRSPLKIMGSYAGAIGQPQFMPSSYRHYAVDFSGDHRIDLSHNESDVIGSIANYYQKHGWKKNQLVTIPASVTGYRYKALLNPSQPISTSDLTQYGIIPNADYPENQKTKLIELKGYYHQEYWLGFTNFDVIKSYNPSNLYAMAVYQLSYYISALRERKNHAN